jgi:hypothetical protein
MTRTTTILCLVLVAATAASAQEDLSTMLRTEDGWVHLAFPAREGVHGNGRSVTIDGDAVIVHDPGDDGLVHLVLRVEDGDVRDLRSRVGGKPRQHERDARDLGEFAAADAARYLLDLGRRSRDDELAAGAVSAAALADAETWPELVRIARDRRRGQETREVAIFWLGQAAGDKVVAELSAIVDDDDEAIDIREHAVFALHQAVEDDPQHALDVLGPIATGNPHPDVRRSALFWLAQHDDPAVVDLFERILLDD